MKSYPSDEHGVSATVFPPIQVPPNVPPTEQELEQRRAIIAEIDRLRTKIGPIGVSVVDLIDQDYYDIDATER